MKIHDVMSRDPRVGRLPNDGQAQLGELHGAGSDLQLREELASFVCEGKYKAALHLIISQYLTDLGSPRQKSAWVSGFFGSGKSHVLKMLTHLWLNTSFADGAEARTLIPKLPDDVNAALKELDTRALQMRKEPVAAAGTMLGGNNHVRATVLAIILRARNLPSTYPQAAFTFWLREEKLLEPLKEKIASAGRDWEKELNNLYVSPHMGKALVELRPGFASTPAEALKAVYAQFPNLKTDISTEQFVKAARMALSEDGELPPTLLILDEVQQYINESPDRAAVFTELAEALQTRMDGRVMLVAAGQSALSSGTSTLLWLKDRFQITIELTDADVEKVIREVLLKKQPQAIAHVEKMFDGTVGEVDRHLRGTRIGPRTEDKRDRLLDYPLLPVRRRFWEACFRAVDAHGTHSQLRSQLRMIHDSLHKMAKENLGAVIPVGDLFQSLAPSLVNTGFLLNEINTRIQKQDDGTPDGILRRDLCGLAFMIGKLPRQEGVDLGLRADPATLADLTLPDLTHDSGPFRQKVSILLTALAEDGTLMKVGDEYRLQTTEGAEWNSDFTNRVTALKQNEIEITSKRDGLIASAVQEIVSGIKLIHGESKVKRSLTLHHGAEPPASGGDHVAAWLMDGWNSAKKSAETEARRLGQDSPALVVFVPKKDADALRDAIVASEAARLVINRRGQPSTPEGREAFEAMDSRRKNAEATRDELIREIVQAATVYQGGGSEVFGESLAGKIDSGARASLDRLFPRFAEADHRAWETVIKRVRDGSEDALKVVGWDNPLQDHPVAKEVMALVRPGVRGGDILAKLRSSPYGWPDDAIGGIVLSLHRAGHIKATRNGSPIAVSALDLTLIKSADFKTETVWLSSKDKITLRGLFDKAGVKTKSGEEELRAPEFLRVMLELAENAGGDAPLPPAPDTAWIADIKRLTGASQLDAILQARQQCEDAITSWTKLGARRSARESKWTLVKAFYEQARELPAAVAAKTQLEGIEQARILLDDDDHVSAIVTALATALRGELQTARKHFDEALDGAKAMLKADATWQALEEGKRGEILRQAGLDSIPPPTLGTDTQLLQALQSRSLRGWRELADAVPQRVNRALAAAAQAASPSGSSPAPTSVTVRRGTLVDETAVRQWLKEHEEKLLAAIKNGAVIIN